MQEEESKTTEDMVDCGVSKEEQPQSNMKHISKKTFMVRSLVMTAILFLVAWIIYGNISIQTTVYEIDLPKGYEELDGLTLVQVSDLHNARFGRENSNLIQAIAKQEPDYIFVTGDLVDSDRTDIDIAMGFIEQATEIAPVYYVTGNHEGWLGNSYSELVKRLKDAGVVILDNKAETISYETICLNIAGVHDPDMPGNNVVRMQDAMTVLIEQLEGYVILLSHRPELYEKYVESGVDLVFTGHAHGGQFRIPYIGGVVAPNQGLFPQYTEGTFTENGTTMVVSRGLGNSVIPVRINNRPEIVVVKLQYTEQ